MYIHIHIITCIHVYIYIYVIAVRWSAWQRVLVELDHKGGDVVGHLAFEQEV